MKRTIQPKSLQEHRRLIGPWRTWLAGAILVLLVAIIYWPTLDNGFASDDVSHITNNISLRSLEGLSNLWFKLGTVEQYFPVVHSMFWVEFQLWGLNPRGYHIVNLLLHATTALLVWRLLLRLAVPGAWLAAAIFAVHPVQVESVAWACELKNVFSCILAIGSLLAYLRFSPPESAGEIDAQAPAARGRWLYYALAFVLYVAALLAKSVTASVPAVLLVVYWWKRGRVAWRDVARLLPFFAAGLAQGYVTLWMEKNVVGTSGEEFELSLVEGVLIAGRALWFYAGKLVWPHPLSFVYPRWAIDTGAWWQYLFPAAALAVIVGVWLARRRIGRGPLAGVLIFAGVLVPVLGFFNIYTFRYTFVVDHYLYHASIALIALAVAAAVKVAARLPKQARWIAPAAAGGLLLPLAIVAQQRTHVWKDSMTVWQDTIAIDPECWIAHNSLGILFQELGKYSDGLSHFRQVVEIQERLVRDHPTATRYQDRLARSHIDVASMQLDMEQPAEAASSLCKAIEIREQLVRDHPAVSDYQYGLGLSYALLALAQQRVGQPVEAEASHRRAIAIRAKLAQDNPTTSKYENDLAGSVVGLGLFQRDMGQPAEAEQSFQKASEIREKLVRDHPTVIDYQDGLGWCHVDLAHALERSGRPAEAAVSYRKALAIREKLARNYPMLGKYANNAAASYVDLGLFLRATGQPAEEASSFRKATKIREKLVRDFPRVSDYQDGLAWCHVNLAVTQQRVGRLAEAEVLYRNAIKVREKLAQDNPTAVDYRQHLAASYRDLGNLQRTVGRNGGAVVAYQKAIAIRRMLATDAPANADNRLNLAGELALCGDALALSGRWSESADRYAEAVAAGNDSWQAMGLLALVQLAAGNEDGYRATCADLVKRHGDNAAPGAALSIAWTLVMGDKALDDSNQVLTLAMRAANEPSNPIAAIVVGAAQYRAGRVTEAIQALTGALARLDSAATAQPDEILVGRLVGELVLTLAYHQQSDQAALHKRLGSLRTWIGNAEAFRPQSSGGLPPWAVGSAVEIAKRQLTKHGLSADAPPLEF